MTYNSWRFNDMAQGVLARAAVDSAARFSGGLVILSIALIDEMVNVLRRQPAELREGLAGRDAGRIPRAHLAGRRRLTMANLGMVELSFILLGFMIVLLAAASGSRFRSGSSASSRWR